MTIDAKERARAKRNVRCPLCGAEPGNRCNDLRPEKAGRTNRHIHFERLAALRELETVWRG